MATVEETTVPAKAEWLRTVHGRIEQELAALKVHLSVARLAAHALSLDDERLQHAADDYDAAQRHVDGLGESIARAAAPPPPPPDAGRAAKRTKRGARGRDAAAPARRDRRRAA